MQHPWIAATVLGLFAALVAWRLPRSLREGVASSFVREYHVDENPIGYSLCILSDMGIIVLGTAVVLHAFGILGEPFAAIDALLPPFLRCQGSCPP
jgi:hypothetical protein